nr:hypothetical protein [Nocardioides alcanivorans]
MSPVSAEQVDEFIRNRPGKVLLDHVYADEAVAINDFIHMSPGSSAAYMLVTPAGRVIVNTGLGYEAPHHRKLFDEVYAGPTRYIVTTQGHTDHVGGVAGFREPGALYVANSLNPSVQRDDARVITRMRQWAPVWFGVDVDTVRGFSQARPDVANKQDVPTPDLMFDDRLALDVGGLQIELHSGVGETVDGAMVWLPQHRIALISNLLGPLFGHFPNLNTIRGQRYRYVEPYLATITKLRDLRPQLLITGRGVPVEGEEIIDAVLKRMYDAVDHIHRATLDGINAGKDVETLVREVTLPDHLYVGQGYGQVKWGCGRSGRPTWGGSTTAPPRSCTPYRGSRPSPAWSRSREWTACSIVRAGTSRRVRPRRRLPWSRQCWPTRPSMPPGRPFSSTVTRRCSRTR